jgi:hypothetical protein
MATLEFVNVPEERTSEQLGPYPFVQVTYDVVRVGPEGETEIAYRRPDGFWVYDGQAWTDFIIGA